MFEFRWLRANLRFHVKREQPEQSVSGGQASLITNTLLYSQIWVKLGHILWASFCLNPLIPVCHLPITECLKHSCNKSEVRIISSSANIKGHEDDAVNVSLIFLFYPVKVYEYFWKALYVRVGLITFLYSTVRETLFSAIRSNVYICRYISKNLISCVLNSDI